MSFTHRIDMDESETLLGFERIDGKLSLSLPLSFSKKGFDVVLCEKWINSIRRHIRDFLCISFTVTVSFLASLTD